MPHARSIPPRPLALIAVLALSAPRAPAQSFADGAHLLPQGSPANGGYSENVDFADVDLDGDFDCLVADGGELGNQKTRLWINQGGLQNGTTGVFVDETNARLTAAADASRDVDFADLDGDGDPDAYVTNSSGVANQTGRFLINQGGAPGGTLGYFQDETSSRWIDLGVNNGTTARSSIAPTLVFPSGGFIDWSCDALLADLDGDGALDLVQSSYGALSAGKTPTRIFLNDGSGHFEEFNPSGFQLPGPDISNGMPGLWCTGTHQQNTSQSGGAECDVALDTIAFEVGDLDGDFDLDLLGGEKFKRPRVYRNLLEEYSAAESLAFMDVSHAVMPPGWASGAGNYEQELGDLDGDGDLDIYGVNWNQINDVMHLNQGDGSFGPEVNALGGERMNEADWLDYDGDGDLDVFVVGNNHAHEVMANPGASGAWLLACAPGEVPDPGFTPSHGGDACDVDGDGDQDYLAACRENQPNVLYLNVTEVADAFAPRIPNLEAVPDREASLEPTRIRAQVYDNSAWYLTAQNPTWLEYQVDGGPVVQVPMAWSGGQVFRAELPGTLEGQVSYRVLSRDLVGNLGSSSTRSYLAGPCQGQLATYCTAGTSSSGCAATLTAWGSPDPTLASGFNVNATNLEAGISGTFFYGFNGPQASPWGNGTSYQCVRPPVVRVGVQVSTGGAQPCQGRFNRDLNVYWTTAPAGQVPPPGQEVQLQLWMRDPGNTSNQKTVLSNGLSFTVCP